MRFFDRKETPTEPTSVEHDPKGAVEDLELARSYLDDWIHKDGGYDALAFASKYIKSARQKDPAVRVTYEKKGETIVDDADDLAGETLFYQAQMHYNPPETSPDRLRKAAEILSKALTYKPASVQYRRLLTDIYLDLHDKDSALRVAEEAITASGNDIEARKLRDRVEAAPRTQAPTYFQKNPEALGCLAGFVLLAGLILLLLGFAYDTAGLGVLLLIAGGVMMLVSRIRESDKMFQQAYADQVRKNRRR